MQYQRQWCSCNKESVWYRKRKGTWTAADKAADAADVAAVAALKVAALKVPKTMVQLQRRILNRNAYSKRKCTWTAADKAADAADVAAVAALTAARALKKQKTQ